MIKRTKLVLILFVLCASYGFSVLIESLLTSCNIARLCSNDNFIYETKFSNSAPELIPADNEFRQFVTGAAGSINYNIMVESLYLYRKPNQSFTSSNSWDDRQKTGLFNQLTAISAMEGIQYYSASRGPMRTFFETSGVVDQPSTKKPLPDPVFTVLPANYSLYARQKDLTFGDNVYRYDYKTANNSICFVQENMTSLTLGIIPAVGRGNLRSVLAVFDCGDTLLIYSVSFARALSISSLSERIGVSFSNRAEAVIKWFTGRADMVLSM
jgi:hypothetical protein